MAVTATPIFTQTPVVATLSLAAVTACTTRAPTVTASLAAANILALTAASMNGLRVDSLDISAASTSITSATTAGLIQVWAWDGTSAFLIDEIVISAVTPSATVSGFNTIRTYSPAINLPAAHRLYVSTTVTTTAATNALNIVAFGGAY